MVENGTVTLYHLLNFEHRLVFLLGNSGSGKTSGFVSSILPLIRCSGGIYIWTLDHSDFDQVSVPLNFLPSDFKLGLADLEGLPRDSLIFYGTIPKLFKFTPPPPNLGYVLIGRGGGGVV